MPEIADPPAYMRDLKRDHRGYPVPWFVKWYGDRPDFRILGDGKIEQAIKQRLCWICGKAMGRYMAFTIGPMCAVNRTSMEPPGHRDCAFYAAVNCPFLANPRMHRQEHNMPEDIVVAGTMIPRNPGACCIWVTRDFKRFGDGKGGLLIEIGEPTDVYWFAHGRPATDNEVWASIKSGLPILLEHARKAGDDLAELQRMVRVVAPWAPLGAREHLARYTIGDEMLSEAAAP